MTVGRRAFMKLLGGGALLATGVGALFRRAAVSEAQAGLALRKVRLEDADSLLQIMNGCVSDEDSFHGKCDTWSRRWAEVSVRRCPETVVITLDGLPVAFHEIPSIRPPTEEPGAGASEEEWEKYELRERSRRTFHLKAVGVRDGVLGPEEAVRMFRRILYYGFRRARALGFAEAECFVPWEHHPKMERAWPDYPGCELVFYSRNQAGGHDLYRLSVRLDEAVEALALEGADDEALELL